MKSGTRVQLMIMMFLQFVVWGAWYGHYPSIYIAIGFDGAQVGNIYSTFSIAMIISPFLVGMIADRFFAAQKVLGVLNLIGAAYYSFLTRITDYPTFYMDDVVILLSLLHAHHSPYQLDVAMRQMRNRKNNFLLSVYWEPLPGLPLPT